MHCPAVYKNKYFKQNAASQNQGNPGPCITVNIILKV